MDSARYHVVIKTFILCMFVLAMMFNKKENNCLILKIIET